MARQSGSNGTGEMGMYLSIVFEFLGTLGFSIAVGFFSGRWFWPNQTGIVLLVAVMLGLVAGIYQMMKRIEIAEKRQSKESQAAKTKPAATIEDSHKAIEELRQMTKRLGRSNHDS